MDDSIVAKLEWYVTNEVPMPIELLIDIIEEIEQLTKERNEWQATAAGLSQDISNAEDEIERLNSLVLNLKDDFMDVDSKDYDYASRVRRKPPGPINRYVLEHSDSELVNVHDKTLCEGESCTIHNKSHHSMRNFPQNWRAERGIMERICPHGVGHPDPDNPWDRSDSRWVHGCDGCCSTI